MIPGSFMLMEAVRDFFWFDRGKTDRKMAEKSFFEEDKIDIVRFDTLEV